MGDDRDAGNVIDVVSIIDRSNGKDNGNDNGYDNGHGINKENGLRANENRTSRLQKIQNIPEKKVSIEDFIMSLANSGNEKHIKLASELIDLNMAQGNTSEHLGPDCFDKISACNDNLSNNTGKKNINDNDNEAKETDMEWTTVKPKQKRRRSGSNDSDSDRTRLETSGSPNKKHKSLKESVGKNKTKQVKTGNKTENSERTPLNKDSVLVIISEILDNTYYNAIKMENMVLAAFPRLKESGMWTKYRVNKRHKNKCYITLPKDHHRDNVTNTIKSQAGFQECKVDVKIGINDVPSKAYKVVAIGVHQSIGDEEIIQKLSKSNVKVNKVQRLKFKGNPTQKVVVEFDQEQDMNIALFNGIYFGRIRIRCEPFRPTPPVTQCYQCQGFNHVAKDCKSKVQCMRCAGPHKSSECTEKDKDSFSPKCINCSGNHVAASRECPKFKEQSKKQTEKVKARQEKIQNSLVVRGVSFSNIVKTNTDKVESTLSEKIQINKKETELELGNIVQKLESKMEESFKALSERIVSFMVNSMVEIYEQLAKKNADKVYNILSKESVECFNIKLHPISPPLSPSAPVATSVTQVDSSKQQNKTKKPNTHGVLSKQVHPPRQAPVVQKIAATRQKKFQNGSKK